MSTLDRALPLDKTEALDRALPLDEIVTTYIEDLYKNKSASSEKVDYELASEKSRMKNLFTLEEIGEPIRLCERYRNDLYCTKGGDCYQLLDSGRYRYMNHLVDQYGDLIVRPSYGSTSQNVKVKRIVAFSWLEVPEELKGYKILWVKHKDGEKKNIHASNLEWEEPYSRGNNFLKNKG